MTTFPTLREVHDFLLGEKPLLGHWFGEVVGGRPYWWRDHLITAIREKK